MQGSSFGSAAAQMPPIMERTASSGSARRKSKDLTRAGSRRLSRERSRGLGRAGSKGMAEGSEAHKGPAFGKLVEKEERATGHVEFKMYKVTAVASARAALGSTDGCSHVAVTAKIMSRTVMIDLEVKLALLPFSRLVSRLAGVPAVVERGGLHAAHRHDGHRCRRTPAGGGPELLAQHLDRLHRRGGGAPLQAGQPQLHRLVPRAGQRVHHAPGVDPLCCTHSPFRVCASFSGPCGTKLLFSSFLGSSASLQLTTCGAEDSFLVECESCWIC